MFSDDDFVAITPVNFFQLSIDCKYLPRGKGDSFPYLTKEKHKKYLLPATSSLCSEDSFAQVAMGWHEEGLEFYVRTEHPVRNVCYPDVSRGDSVEVFIDTRDVKTSGFNTRFCHHFFFLPESVEGQAAGEITKFRTEEEKHPLCDAQELKVKSICQPSNYVLHMFIPSHCLNGYDPQQFHRLGFTYRINKPGGYPQHFSAVTEDFHIEQQPSLWSSLNLVQDKG